MAIDDLRALIEMLRAAGVHYYKTPELELQLGPEPATPEPERKLSENEREEYEQALALAHVQPLPGKFRQ